MNTKQGVILGSEPLEGMPQQTLGGREAGSRSLASQLELNGFWLDAWCPDSLTTETGIISGRDLPQGGHEPMARQAACGDEFILYKRLFKTLTAKRT